MRNLRKVETSYRIMKILKLLYEKPRSLDELCFELDSNEIGVEKDTITKYFSTLRSCGCIIEKRGGKFWLKHMPFFIDLNRKELEILAYFQKFSQKFNSRKFDEKIQSIFSKILKITDLKTHSKYHEILNQTKSEDLIWLGENNLDKLSIISNLLEENIRIKVKYQEKYLIIVPKCLKFIKNNVYLSAFCEDSKKYRNLQISNITEISGIDKNKGSNNFASTTVFKLKGRLAKGYYPYEEETLQDLENGEKIVSNKLQDKNILMKRLIKYGSLCEIISPKDEKDLFLSEIDKMIANLSAN